MEQIIKQRSWPAAVSTLVPMLGLLFLAAPTGARADDHYVAQGNQTPSHPYESWTTAASNIQDAISATAAGDTVWVSNGVYQTGGVTNWPAGCYITNRVSITNAITVRSANNNPANTLIVGEKDPVDGGKSVARCVYMVAGAKLIGFTITNGGAVVAYEAGSTKNNYCGGVKGASTGAIVSNCVFLNNRAFYHGAVEACKVYNSTFMNNSASGCGGVGSGNIMYDCTMISNRAGNGGCLNGGTCYNCTLMGNEVTGAGGAMRMGTLFNCMVISNRASKGAAAVCGAVLSNCTVIGNSASGAGGVTVYVEGRSTFYNCLLAGNSAKTVGGVAAEAGFFYNCTMVGNWAANGGGVCVTGNLVNCIVYDNIATNAGGGDNWWGSDNIFTNSCTFPEIAGWAAGNITNDPVFTANGSGYGTNLVPGNYRLGGGSPCVNAGMFQPWMTNGVDRDLKQRIRYGTVDMGAYERVHDASLYNFH